MQVWSPELPLGSCLPGGGVEADLLLPTPRAQAEHDTCPLGTGLSDFDEFEGKRTGTFKTQLWIKAPQEYQRCVLLVGVFQLVTHSKTCLASSEGTGLFSLGL